MTIAAVVPSARKKFSIFTSAITPYGLSRNAVIAVGRHRADRVEEEAEQHVLEAAERHVDRARDAQRSAEHRLAARPQPLRDGADRAEPAAERLAEEQRCAGEGDEQEEARGVDRRAGRR